MPVLYSDPWKDNHYGKLKGEKQDTYFNISFDEARAYNTETGYVFCAYITSYSGVTHSFKAVNPLEPGLCTIPVHNSEWESREKVLGEWNTVKHEPSKFEKALCDCIFRNENLFLNDTMGFKGSIGFVPDAMCASLDDGAMKTLVDQNVNVEPTPFTGKLPAYVPPKTYRKGNNNGSYSKGASVEDKLKLIKKELVAFSENDHASETNSLGQLVMQVWSEHVTEEDFLNHYFDVLTAVVR